MITTINGTIKKQGKDCEYDEEVKISFCIDDNADMIININNEPVFKANCQEVKRAIDAHNINSY